jgi:hypothetical protein
MKKELYFYRLTDTQGNQDLVVIDQSNDNGCIGGIGADGEYHQYDSYELYHAHEWAEKYGMKLESGRMEVDIPDSIFIH